MFPKKYCILFLLVSFIHISWCAVSSLLVNHILLSQYNLDRKQIYFVCLGRIAIAVARRFRTLMDSADFGDVPDELGVIAVVQHLGVELDRRPALVRPGVHVPLFFVRAVEGAPVLHRVPVRDRSVRDDARHAEPEVVPVALRDEAVGQEQVAVEGGRLAVERPLDPIDNVLEGVCEGGLGRDRQHDAVIDGVGSKVDVEEALLFRREGHFPLFYRVLNSLSARGDTPAVCCADAGDFSARGSGRRG
jgi:hypothetical protein